MGSRRVFEVQGAPESIADAVLGALADTDQLVRARAIADAARMVDPEQLLEAVGDQDNSLRRNAAMDALSKGGARSVPTLVRALHDDDPEVVMFAATILGKTRDPAAVPHLVVLVDESDVKVAQAAIESLAQLRAAAAVPALIRALERDFWVRFAAVHALGEIGSPDAANALIPLVEDPMLRDVAVLALGRISTVEALAKLAGLLRDSVDSDGFFTCLRALGEALEGQPNESTLFRMESWQQLARASDVHLRLLGVLASDEDGGAELPELRDTEIKGAAAKVIRALRIQNLYTPMVLAGRSPQLREVLQFCAVSIGRDIAGSLAIGLAYPNRNVRMLACHCAGVLRLRGLASRVEELLQDADSAMRRIAAETLARMAREASVPRMVELLLDADEEVREAVAAALSSMDADLVTRALLEWAEGDEARWPAALAVAQANPHPAQWAFLDRCLRHASGDIRRAAVQAVAAQPRGDAVEVITPFLRDPVVGVRVAAIGALARRHPREVREILLEHVDRDAASRPQTIRAFADMKDAGVAPHLIEMFRSGGHDEPTRLAIIDALAELREPAAEPLIVRLLADGDAEIRRTAVKALGSFGSSTAIRHLAAASRDQAWQVRAAVAEVLDGNSEAVAVATLERLSLDAHPLVAGTARRGLEDAYSE